MPLDRLWDAPDEGPRWLLLRHPALAMRDVSALKDPRQQLDLLCMLTP